MLELWEMRSTSSFPSLPRPLRSGVVTPIYESHRTKLYTYAKLNSLKYNCFYIFFLCVKTWSSEGVVLIGADSDRVKSLSFYKRSLGCISLTLRTKLFVYKSQWFSFLKKKSCLVLYSFCGCIFDSFIRWLTVSYLSPHKLPAQSAGIAEYTDCIYADGKNIV